MNNQKLLAYAVDSETGNVTWRLYERKWDNEHKRKAD